ncbi:MAG TPA: hypothetical protein PKD24_06215 [Pyrinomonadaceae bacterium]|nr:hypothetical protein [Pyrinomonadaceae bacterium]HMP65249.1 hypothetical protein [Pyrinomonadaceae bacterium]
MSNFGKNEDCPSSQELLEFQNGDLSIEESRPIGRHLAVCEFCAAEAEFYERYPTLDERTPPSELPEIPRPLYELAEALLSHKRESIPLEKLIEEIDTASRGDQ